MHEVGSQWSIPTFVKHFCIFIPCLRPVLKDESLRLWIRSLSPKVNVLSPETASIVIIFGAFIGYRLWETRMKYGLMEIIHPSVQSYCYQLVSCYTYSTFRRWFFLDIITVSTETYCRGTMNHIDLAVTNGLIPSYDYGHACYLQYADEFVRLAVEFLDETAVIVGSKRRRRNQLIVCLQRVYRQNLGISTTVSLTTYRPFKADPRTFLQSTPASGHAPSTNCCRARLDIRVPARQFIHLFSDLKKPCDTLASRGVSLQQHSTMLPPGELVFIKRGHSSAVIIVGGGDEELRGLDVHLVVGIGMQCISSRVDSVGIVDFDQKLAHGREDLIPELHELQNQIRTIRGSLNNTCKKDFRSHSSNPPIHFKIAAGTKTSSGRTARSRMSVNVGMEAGIASAIEVKW
ncbi:hypothetical protein KCV01_g86, partial [Aureobasidium melanogenum]